MRLFLTATVLALIFSSIGFKKYVWFLSYGYGFAVAAIGAYLLIAPGAVLTAGTACAGVLFLIYGCRLNGFLAFRDLSRNSSYADRIKKEINIGKDISFGAKCAIWISSALLYACQTSPVLFRVAARGKTDPVLTVGLVISLLGLVIETAADLQKNAAKRDNPARFVDRGLYRIVRCPNYFGEVLFWTGVFVGGIPVLHGPAQWIAALVGYLGILYVMFGGARRLEIRQKKNYGSDPAYQKYAATTPIMIPFVPLYSLERYKWLVT